MSLCKKIIAFMTFLAMTGMFCQKIEAACYVTDTGGYAYDECRAVTNLAPAIALGTVAVVGIIAIAVNNSHHHSSTSSSHHTHGGCYSSSYSSSTSSYCPTTSTYTTHCF